VQPTHVAGLMQAMIRVCLPVCLHCQVAKVLSATDAVSGQLKRRLKVASSVPTDFFCLVRGSSISSCTARLYTSTAYSTCGEAQDITEQHMAQCTTHSMHCCTNPKQHGTPMCAQYDSAWRRTS
jgi:hypothetical protein